MNVVWKWKLELGESEIDIPKEYQILSAKSIDNKVYVWALVDPRFEQVKCKMLVAGTGFNLPALSTLIFIDTVVLHDGDIIVHVFNILN